MGHPPLEKLLPKAGGSVYKLSRLAAKRAADLASGRKPLVECDSRTKTATIALEEISSGMVMLKECAGKIKPDLPAEKTAPVDGAEEQTV